MYEYYSENNFSYLEMIKEINQSHNIHYISKKKYKNNIIFIWNKKNIIKIKEICKILELAYLPSEIANICYEYINEITYVEVAFKSIKKSPYWRYEHIELLFNVLINDSYEFISEINYYYDILPTSIYLRFMITNQRCFQYHDAENGWYELKTQYVEIHPADIINNCDKKFISIIQDMIKNRKRDWEIANLFHQTFIEQDDLLLKILKLDNNNNISSHILIFNVKNGPIYQILYFDTIENKFNCIEYFNIMNFINKKIFKST
jgi:hypothetical protein